MALHHRLGRIRITRLDQSGDLAVFTGRLGDGPRIVIARSVIGQKLARIGLDHLGQERVACRQRHGFVKPQVQLIIAVRIGIALFSRMGLAGQNSRLKPCGPSCGQPPCRQTCRLPFKFGVHLQNGEELFQRGPKQRGPFAGMAAD